MSAIDEKLEQCRIALDDLSAVRQYDDVPKFLTRFTGYANQVSAVRQYVQNSLANLKSATMHPEQQWLQALEDDVTFAAVMGLRHIDQHDDAVRVARKHVSISLEESALTSEGSLSIVATDAQGNITQQVASEAAPRPAPPPPKPSTVEFAFFCNPATVPEFMTAQHAFKSGYSRIPGQGPVLVKGDDLPLKAAVIVYLQGTDLEIVARRSYTALADAIGDARTRGFLI